MSGTLATTEAWRLYGPHLAHQRAGSQRRANGGEPGDRICSRNVRCMVNPMVVSMAAIYDAFSEVQEVRRRILK
jgi:hypothetical protein